MRTFLFWWLVSFLACSIGAGVVALYVYGLIPRALVVSFLCGLVILWINR